MEKLVIVCVDDQRDVLAALRKDLSILEKYIEIEECDTASEAMEVLDELDVSGKSIALVISDHIMPEKSGVDFLRDLNQDARFTGISRFLLTGLATHQDTITAINEANIERYFEKPWSPGDLLQAVRAALTSYILKNGLNYQEYQGVIDQKTLLKGLHRS